MKKIIFLVIVIATSCNSNRTKSVSVNNPNGEYPVPHSKIEHQAQLRTDSLTAVLSLSEEQKTQVYAMILKGREAEVACKPLKAVNQQTYVTKKKEVITECYNQIKTVLSQDQQKELEAYLPTLKCFKDFW
jgi:hypothetical protein